MTSADRSVLAFNLSYMTSRTALLREAMGQLLGWLEEGSLRMPAVTTYGAASAGMLAAAFWLLIMGGLVLADAKLSLRTMTLLVALLGLFHGYFNGTGMGLSARTIIAAFGVTAALFVLVALVSALIVRLRAHWARIAVRVGGSWIAASGLLMLGWSIRGG